MSDLKTAILMQFDQIILEMETLLSTMPDQSWYRVNSRITYQETPKIQKDNFYSIRSRYLALLISIPSNDDKLRAAIEHVRSIEPLEFNMERMLDGMRELRSDYEAGILIAAKSPGNTAQIIELILREALYETENFQPPYASSEIIQLEQTIKRAVRMAFGEDSSHYETIHYIFHQMFSESGTNKEESADEKLQRHIQYWKQNQESLISTLQILPDEFRLNKLKDLESKTLQQTADDMVVKQKQGFLNDARATIIAAIIGGVFTLIATFIGYLLITYSTQSSNAQTSTQSPTIQVTTQTPFSTIPFQTLTP